MEGINNDSEGHYAQKDFQGNSDGCTRKQSQLQTATSKVAPASKSGTSNEDLSRAASEDRSPMLTPNTAQDWVNEDNLECTSHRDKTVPAEGAMKGHNLDDTQGSSCGKLKNVESVRHDSGTATEDSSFERSEQSSDIEDHPEVRMKDEPRQLPFEPRTVELDACEAIPGVQTPSKIYEEKTKPWFTEEFSNLVKSVPVRTSKNSLSGETRLKQQSRLEIQTWVEASLLTTCGDAGSERPLKSERRELVHSRELQTDADALSSRQDIYTIDKCTMHPVTMKFVINDMRAFTFAFEMHRYVREVRDTLSKKFHCQPADLQLIRNGESLSDSLQISELGVEPYGTVEIEIKAKGSLRTESIYDIPAVPDVITVRVVSAAEDVRDVVVEIESRSIRKPFIGGYRHKVTGVEYHHAFTQTPLLHFTVSAGGKRCRDTQTAKWKEKQQNTMHDVATQMNKTDCYIPSHSDKVLEAKKYIAADEWERHAALDVKAIVIQRCWKGYVARKRYAKVKMEIEEYYKWETEESRRAERERDECSRKEQVRKMFPRTRADYEILYAMVENWRQAEIKRISSMKSDAPKRAEFCFLLKKEIESLNTIERYRMELKKEKVAKKELSILEKSATPITWVGYKGKQVSMETVHIQRAKELKELYYIMSEDNVTAKERMELLISLKRVLKSYNARMRDELILLLERECNYLMHGVKAMDLATLRQRIQKLFIELMKDPEFNPQAAKHMIFNWKENEGKMHFCQHCQKLKPFTEFIICTKTQTFERCISCAWTDEIARSRSDLEPYRFMIRALRRDERRRKCSSSLAFIMQDKDFYSLIVNIWHRRSPVSEVADLQKLCLGRWDVTNDWTPWNCILLTADEMRAHNEVKDIKETYAPDFIALVRLKHRLAEFQFSHLYKFDKDYAGSGKSCADKGTED